MVPPKCEEFRPGIVRLPALLRELELRAREDGWRRQQKQHEADFQRRHWEEAIDRAEIDFREGQRTAVLTAQLDRVAAGQRPGCLSGRDDHRSEGHLK
jgi:hypothetical protein